MSWEVDIRILIAAATGVGVGLLLFLGWTPEPTPVRGTVFGILAYWWALGGMSLMDRIGINRKHRDDSWL